MAKNALSGGEDEPVGEVLTARFERIGPNRVDLVFSDAETESSNANPRLFLMHDAQGAVSRIAFIG